MTRCHRHARAQAQIAGWVGAVFAGALGAQTEIQIDSSWGRTPAKLAPTASATTVVGNAGKAYTVPGGLYSIREADGKVAGRNLFHSFQSFSVGAGDAAVFTTATSTLQNVISRVSGSSPTRLDGLLMLKPENGGAPNFFFLNPAGISFGAGAQVDVPGAFHASTANRLRFSDGTLFAAGAGSDSTLTIAPPEAFGFLGATGKATFRGVDRPPSDPIIANRLDVAAGEIEVIDSYLSTRAASTAPDESTSELRLLAVGDAIIDIPVAGSPGMVEAAGHLAMENSIVESSGLTSLSAIDTRGTLPPAAPIHRRRLEASAVAIASDGSIDVRGSTLSFSGVAVVSEASSRSGGHITLRSSGDISIDRSRLSADTSGAGTGGGIAISTQGNISLSNVAEISTRTIGTGNAGDITISSGNLSLERSTVSSRTESGGPAQASGNAGNIRLDVGGSLDLLDDSFVKTEADGSTGTAGRIDVQAREIFIEFGAISAAAEARSRAAPPGIAVAAQERITLGQRGIISMRSEAAGDLLPPPTAITVVTPELHFGENAFVETHTAAAGTLGSIRILADDQGGGELRITGSGAIGGVSSNSTGVGGRAGIEIEAGTLILTDVSVLSVTLASGDAGTIALGAAADLTIEDSLVSTATVATGSAGVVTVMAGGGLSLVRSTISSDSVFGAGRAGEVAVSARSIHLDAGVISSATVAGAGDGGSVSVTATDRLTLVNESFIAASTLESAGRAGGVDVSAREITLANSFILAEADALSSGQTGNVTVTATQQVMLSDRAELSIANSAVADEPSDLSRTTLTVVSPQVVLANESAITADTSGNVAASSIVLMPSVSGAGALRIAGDGTVAITSSASAGVAAAGDVRIAADSLHLSGANILSDARPGTTGAAGAISVAVAGDLSISGRAGLGTDTAGAGRAGDVRLTAGGSLTLREGSMLSSSTHGAGTAGTLTLEAAEIRLDGQGTAVTAAAARGSSGQTGSLTVRARNAITLSDGAVVSIQNDATVVAPDTLLPTALSVAARNITLRDAKITAASTGNVAASDVRISFADRLTIDPSSITTGANQGDGGDIFIDGGRLIWLDHSQITTSVLGLVGNGGDISMRAETLLMESGFVQANTAGTGSSGGRVVIDTRALLASGGGVLVGGDIPLAFDPATFGLNVIQAAAPAGVSGLVGIAAPVLDIAGELSAVEAEVIDMVPLGRDLCRAGTGSSLTPLGRGGLRARAAAPLRPDVPALGSVAGRSVSKAWRAERPPDSQLLAASERRCAD
jgi:filamentous hemagglutinin family protein